MIPPDAGREPRTDSPKFRRVVTDDLISQKSQQGKEKVALCQLLWDKVGLHRLYCHKSPGPPAPNASYLVGVPTWIPQGNAESAHPPTTPGRSSSLILVAEHSCALISLSSRSHATPTGLAQIARPPLFRARPSTQSQDSLPYSKAHTRSQTSPRLR